MPLTLVCIVVSLSSLLVIGLPVAWLLNGRVPLTERCWVKVPFLGLGTIVLVLQNLVYLRVPIIWSAPLVWGAAAPLWIWLFRSGQLRVIFARLPWALYIGCLAVYLLHGLGLLQIGARYYVGRCWPDEFNYTVTAQSLITEPYHYTGHIPSVREQQKAFSKPDLMGRPYLVRAWWLSHTERIGAELLQGFFAVSSRADAKTLFEPTILVCAPLVVLAIYALCRALRLGRWPALIAALSAGLLPGLALMHLESFLAQALATPLLLYAPAGLWEACQRPRFGRLAGMGLILAGAVAIYAEYWLIFLALIVLLVGLAAIRPGQRGRLLGCGLALVAAPCLLNPGFVPVLWRIQHQLNVAHYETLRAVYPWAFRVEGLTNVWLGNDPGGQLQLGPIFMRVWALGLTVLGYLGLLEAVKRQAASSRASGWDRRTWRTFTLTAGVLAVALLPLAVLARDDQHPYQFYKLLLSVSPLLVVGLALLCQGPLPGLVSGDRGPLKSAVARWRVGLCVALLAAVAFLGGLGTRRMAVQSASLVPDVRCNAGYFLASDVREAQDRLGSLHNRDLLIAVPYRPAQLFSGWLAYFARENRLLLAHPVVNDLDVEALKNPGDVFLPVGPRALPEGLLLLTSRGNFRPGTASQARLLWGNQTFELWEPGPGAWAVTLREMHLDSGREAAAAQADWTLDRGATTVEVLASQPGTLMLRGRLKPGPTSVPWPHALLRVLTNGGYDSVSEVYGREAGLAVPVAAGKNVVTVTMPRDQASKPLADAISSPRPVDAGNPGLRSEFIPSATDER